MNAETQEIKRPQRWDHPLDPNMSQRDVEWLMGQAPFTEMDAGRFPKSTPLSGIIRNDTRIVKYNPGEIVIREGDYGGSAFLVVRGTADVVISKLPTQLLGREKSKKQGHLKALWQSWTRSRFAEVRPEPGKGSKKNGDAEIGLRDAQGDLRVFIQDVSGVLAANETLKLGPGEIFGELSAIGRTPRPFSVVCSEPAILLEIRWQGLRSMRRDPGFKDHLDRLYRENSLRSHLRETPLMRFLPDEQLQSVAAATEFISLGDMEWFSEYKKIKKLDIDQQIKREVLIAEEGQPAEWLYLIRSGFARLSHLLGNGHRTLAYLGKGQVFGLAELAHNYRKTTSQPRLPYQESIRAIGYTDILRIPRQAVEEYLFPFVRTDELPPMIPSPRLFPGESQEQNITQTDFPLETGLLEFLVDKRLMNGRQAMIIDTDRCTRCDDCVKACAATHNNNPRFIRHGPQYKNLMFAHACMHCVDPVCMIGCPTGAISREPTNGVVTINSQTCIGCKTCAESCPYDNIQMVEICDSKGRSIVDQEKGLPIIQATKCDMCYQSPSGPACLSACPHDALIRMDMADLHTLSDWVDRKNH